MRIAVSSSTFRRPLAGGALTQLEWVERCASLLGADGVLADIADFPRTDGEYVAQLRKVAVDLGLVPFGIDAPSLLDPAATAAFRDEVVAIAAGFGAAVIRTVPSAPGEVPPATFVETVRAAKALARAAKGANVTVLVAAAPGTLGEDLAGVKHLLKDVDSAWLRAAPSALVAPGAIGPKDRHPAFIATASDDPAAVAAQRDDAWVILDQPDAAEPWDAAASAVRALRVAAAEHQLERA
ncbi:MAG: hypothetical protein JO103_11965 [Candidatus Eremiobacteraeota bacterium]|nr:hypothetical protein [Candidatus Eremiobacteraeota bacterium]